MKTYTEIINEKLEEIRKSKKITKAEFAKRSKIPRTSINNYLINGRSLNLDTLSQLCQGLGIDMFTFLDECKREKDKYD